MKNRQVNFIAMCRRVSDLINKNTSIFQEFPAFGSFQNSFDSNLTEIQRLGTLQATSIKGLRIKKANMKLNLSRNTMIMSSRAEAYSLRVNDFVLQKKIHRAETHLLKLSDVNFTVSCSIVYHSVLQYREVLKEYGVNEASLLNLKTAMDDYKAVMDTPKEAIIARKQLTLELAKRIEGQRAILDNIDKLVGLMLSKKPAILAEYWDNRKVLYRSRALAVQCKVTDAGTGKGIYRAGIAFYGNGALVLQKTTYKAGGAKMKSLTEGIYTITCSKIGYQTQTLTVSITNDELNAIEVALEKAVILEKVKA